MVHNPRRIQIETANDVVRHLNGWAAGSLATPEHWSDALVATRQWLDLSARNQVLLASYGIDGPVAGAETWRLVPSTTDGRPCAVRAGEHGWPIRVPITTGGSEPDPYLGGTRPSRSVTDRFEWRRVFSIAQLARRPGPDTLVPVEVPAPLTGRWARDHFLDAARQVAATSIRGRLPPSGDPQQVLADAAVRISRNAKGPTLDVNLARQAAWLVADRIGLTTGGLPAYDPEPLEPKDRWAHLQAVLDPARKLTAALGDIVGTDLTASPLPKMDIVDDRVVPARRPRRLPAASLEQLPVGTWYDVGPYSPDEWAARGEPAASGRGSFLRLNKSAYVVAVENGAEAGWRLVDAPERTGGGLLATGTAATLADAKADAVAALAGRYPAIGGTTAVVTATPTAGIPPQPRPPADWEPTPGQGSASALQRRLNDRVTIHVFPGPGRWLPAVQDGTELTRLPYVRSQDQANRRPKPPGNKQSGESCCAPPPTWTTPSPPSPPAGTTAAAASPS